MATHVSREQAGAVGTITIDRPDKLNALSTEIEDALRDEFDGLADAGARAVILRTTGDAFIAGADLQEIHRMS